MLIASRSTSASTGAGRRSGGRRGDEASVDVAQLAQDHLDRLQEVDRLEARDDHGPAVVGGDELERAGADDRRDVAGADEAVERVEAATAARELAQKRLEAEQSKFEVGMSTNYFDADLVRRATDGLPLHLTHIQFHSYATEGDVTAPASGANSWSPDATDDTGTFRLFGLAAIIREPQILRAIDPRHAVRFFLRNGIAGFWTLGVVFLVATGAEALYADVGRFGKRPMRIDWLLLVWPALLLNYFGQGSLLLREPRDVGNPFFLLAPSWALVPLVLLATAAALIASQAIIAGSYSLTRQAVQLGYLPRVTILHTSRAEMGQIYISGTSWVGILGTAAVILYFGTSTRLAGAYGVSIAGVMAITTVLACRVSRDALRWGRARAYMVAAIFLAIDLLFLAANLPKVRYGGWVSLAAAATAFILMTTWRRGRQILGKRLEADTLPLDVFLEGYARKPRLRVPGTAIFMDRISSGTPPALLQNLVHNKAMHERVVFLSVLTDPMPFVSRRRRAEVESLREGFHRITLHYGYMQDPDVPKALTGLLLAGKPIELMSATFFLGRETLIPHGTLGMAIWREKLFAFMSRNATSAMAFFRLPPNQVVEMGAQIEI